MNIHTVEWNLFLFSCVGDAEKHFFFFFKCKWKKSKCKHLPSKRYLEPKILPTTTKAHLLGSS